MKAGGRYAIKVASVWFATGLGYVQMKFIFNPGQQEEVVGGRV
jgi:hypothetical protein